MTLPTRVMITGSGAREHALAWKLSQELPRDRLFVAPGNPGMEDVATLVPISATSAPELVDFAVPEGIELVVLGPDDSVMAGVGDAMRAAGLAVCGPDKAAGLIEGSKAWAKEVMRTAGIPTPDFVIFDEPAEAVAYSTSAPLPVVVKADGLARGKGVIVCETREEAISAVHQIMVLRVFGEAGRRIVVENFVDGVEATFMFFTDGEHVVPMPLAEDEKRSLEGGRGPNTGGMGAYTPIALHSEHLVKQLIKIAALPMLGALRERGAAFHGIVNTGLMLTPAGPVVLEYNARFGDPETELLMPLLRSRLLPILYATATGGLDKIPVEWSDEAALNLSLCSPGYPESPVTGMAISGLDSHIPGTHVFHAGTERRGKEIVTAGGRVLNVMAHAADLSSARALAYKRARLIDSPGLRFRQDIGLRALGGEQREEVAMT
jgi:phosphoribosylamine---glycine ligase